MFKFADEVHGDVLQCFFRDKIVRIVVLVLVTENLGNFQENIRMAQYVSYADSAWDCCPSIYVFGFS